MFIDVLAGWLVLDRWATAATSSIAPFGVSFRAVTGRIKIEVYLSLYGMYKKYVYRLRLSGRMCIHTFDDGLWMTRSRTHV